MPLRKPLGLDCSYPLPSMERYLIEVRGKFYLETDQELENIPGDIYARIEEGFRSSDDIIDIEIETYTLPPSGASD
jgi:hypothetical protein